MTRLLHPLLGTSFLVCLTALAAYGAISTVIDREQSQPQTESVHFDALEVNDRVFSARAPRPEAYYRAITERPLFAPGRRPVDARTAAEQVEPIQETPPSSPIPEPEFELLGVMQVGEQPTALIRPDDGTAVWVSEGQSIQGWNITEIEANSVEISRDARRISLRLYP